MTVTEALPANLENIRLRRGWTKEELCKQVGVGRSTLHWRQRPGGGTLLTHEDRGFPGTGRSRVLSGERLLSLAGQALYRRVHRDPGLLSQNFIVGSYCI